MKCSEKTNCEISFPTSVSQPSEPIRLLVQGLGHVPSFKNRKRAILDSNTGKMRTLTEPKAKQWMARCTDSFVLQLISKSLTIDAGTSTECSPRSLIARSLPRDDSLQWIPEIHVTCQNVDKGHEGAEILIEQL